MNKRRVFVYSRRLDPGEKDRIFGAYSRICRPSKSCLVHVFSVSAEVPLLAKQLRELEARGLFCYSPSPSRKLEVRW